MPLPVSTLIPLSVATLVWCAGWVADVATTVRGLRASGSIAMEQNPIARVLLRRLGVAGAFLALGAVEASVVAAHWGVASLGGERWWAPSWLTVGSATASLLLSGVAHALAAYGNHRGAVVPVLRPVLRAYVALGRRWRV